MMNKNLITFAYPQLITNGAVPIHPNIWWRTVNSEPHDVFTVAVTIGVILTRNEKVAVSVDIHHDDSNLSAITDESAGAEQENLFWGFPRHGEQYIGISTFNIKGVRLPERGTYRLTVRLKREEETLYEVLTYFFLELSEEIKNG